MNQAVRGFCLDTLLLPLVSLLFERLDKVMRRLSDIQSIITYRCSTYPTEQFADHYPAELYTLNVGYMNNLRTCKCVGIIIVTICQKPLEIPRYFCKQSCGVVNLIVHSYVTQFVGLSVDFIMFHKMPITNMIKK